MSDIVTFQLDLKTLRINDAIEKMVIGHGMLSVGEAMAAFQSAVDAMAKPTSTRPIPLSALRHQQQRIGLFVPR